MKPLGGKVLLAVLVAVSLLAGGCGGGSSSTDATSSSKTDAAGTKESTPAKAETTASEKSGAAAPSHPSALWVSGPQAPIRYQAELKIKPSGLAGSEPKPFILKAHRPDRITMKDLLDGIGTYFSVGEKVTVQYVAFDYKTGKKLASSWDKGRPVTFTLGAGEVVPAWEEALNGMEIGDRRVVVAPPKLASGNYPPNIPKGETVGFILELLPRSSAKKAEKPPQAKAPKQS
jgi:peptidylprolyl isomerase